MLSSQTWPLGSFPVIPCSPAAWRGDLRDLAGAEDGDGMRMAGAARRGCHGDGEGRYCAGSEIVVGCLGRPWVFDVVLYLRGMGRTYSRGGSRGSTEGHVYDEGIVDSLSTGEVSIKRPGHGLLGTKHPFLLVSVGPDAKGEVGRIELTTQRVGVFAQNHFAHIIYQVVLVDGDEGGGRAGPLDPDLPCDHIAVDREQLIAI